MKRLAKLFIVLGIGGISSGCAPALLGANHVGDDKPATWVFIHTDDKNENGVFRCVDTNGVPVCTKANMRTK